MSRVEERLGEMEVTLPTLPTPLANYVPAKRAGNLVFTAGRTLQEARVFSPSDEHIDSVTSSETRLYAVSPSMSMPAQSWIEADPDFWKRP